MIVVFGSVNTDLIFRLPEFPQPGQTVLASHLSIEPGGKGANQACAAARDGATVALAGAVGTDALADAALATLRTSGVDLSRLHTATGPTGCATISTDAAGRNQIVVASGANAAVRATWVEDALLHPDTIVVTQMEVPPDETGILIRRARKAGARVVHNHAPALPLPSDILALVDFLIVNEDEAAFLLTGLVNTNGMSAAALSAALGTTVICTLGAAGVAWAGPLGKGQLAARPIEVVDTTAAGDCFTGVLAAALDRGQSLAEAITRANTAASLACTRPGSQSSLPTRTETGQALQQPP